MLSGDVRNIFKVGMSTALTLQVLYSGIFHPTFPFLFVQLTRQLLLLRASPSSQRRGRL